jgi:hypothetical protein
VMVGQFRAAAGMDLPGEGVVVVVGDGWVSQVEAVDQAGSSVASNESHGFLENANCKNPHRGASTQNKCRNFLSSSSHNSRSERAL